MKKIIVACGSGVATSQTVASKIENELKERDIEAIIEVTDFRTLESLINQADAFVSIVGDGGIKFDKPTFNGLAFLTGIDYEEELKKLINFLKE